MRFTINLATRTYLDQQLVTRGLVTAILLLALFCGWKFVALCSNLGELERLGSDVAALEGRLHNRPPGVSQQEYNRQLARIRFFNEIIGRKTVNWLGLLDQLELVTPEGVALATVTPELKNGLLKIEGRAKSFGQVRTYLEHLDDSTVFSDVLLTSHADLAVSEKKHGVRFAMSCKVVGP